MVVLCSDWEGLLVKKLRLKDVVPFHRKGQFGLWTHADLNLKGLSSLCLATGGGIVTLVFSFLMLIYLALPGLPRIMQGLLFPRTAL